MLVRTVTCCVLAVVLLVATGCPKSGTTLPPISPMNGTEIGAKAIEQYDADKDGKISGAELDKCPALKDSLARVDTNRDKAITADEIAARVNAWLELGASEHFLNISVRRNGKPLKDAQVKLVPEKFVGGSAREMSGRSVGNGMVQLVGPGESDEMAGVPIGYYRVEITKPGEDVPAMYNTESTLGLEVAADSLGIQTRLEPGQVVFNLKY